MKSLLNNYILFVLPLFIQFVFLNSGLAQNNDCLFFSKGKIFNYICRKITTQYTDISDDQSDTCYIKNFQVKVDSIYRYNDTLAIVVLSNFFDNYGVHLLCDQKNKKIYILDSDKMLVTSYPLAKQLLKPYEDGITPEPLLNLGKCFICASFHTTDFLNNYDGPESLTINRRFLCLDALYKSKRYNCVIKKFTTDEGLSHKFHVLGIHANEKAGIIRWREWTFISKKETEILYVLNPGKDSKIQNQTDYDALFEEEDYE